MSTALLVHPSFDGIWPFAADHAHQLLRSQGSVEFVRLSRNDDRCASQLLERPADVRRLVTLHVPFTSGCLDVMPNLREAVILQGQTARADLATEEEIRRKGIRIIRHQSQGYWGQSVAEFGLALTLCGLRRIPQLHHEILSELGPWNYDSENGVGLPRGRGQQFGDDVRFASGTLEGKRVRIVGAGNIASRYASFCHFMGADVAAWDPFASEPCFHRAGARREYFLERLVRDAEIFVPMVPLTADTREIVTAENLKALPKGTLVVLVTRAAIVHVPTLRRRVLADELALAADVFDIEPLPIADPLLGRHNVVHTPHNAGRTREANERYAEMLVEQFEPGLGERVKVSVDGVI